MSDSSRRGFLKVAGVGVAAAGTAAVTSSLTSSAQAAEPEAKLPAGAQGSLVAYVNDVHGDEMTVMVQGREVVIHDKKLVNSLAQHMHNASLR